MASRQSEAERLVARCKAVGWPTERSDGFYVVKPPDGRRMQIHLTPSDMHSNKNLERQLNDAGLAAAEEKLKAKRDAAKKAKMEQQRIDADRKAQAMAAQSSALARAAGPYAGPLDLPLEHFIKPHPSFRIDVVNMTPVIANHLLKHHNTANVELSDGLIRKNLAMINGVGEGGTAWKLTHQGGAQDWNAIVLDGQHRLSAIVKSGRTVPICWAVGVDPAAFPAIDSGRSRRPREVLSLKAGVGRGQPSTLATLQRVVCGIDNNETAGVFGRSYNNVVASQMLDADGEHMIASVKYAKAAAKRAHLKAGPLAAAHYLIGRANGSDNLYVKAFFAGLASGRKADGLIAIDENDPRMRMRNTFIGRRLARTSTTTLDNYALMVVTWNRVIEDSPRPPVWRRGDPIPKILTVDPSGACPPMLEGEVE